MRRIPTGAQARGGGLVSRMDEVVVETSFGAGSPHFFESSRREARSERSKTGGGTGAIRSRTGQCGMAQMESSVRLNFLLSLPPHTCRTALSVSYPYSAPASYH